jgi:hypothetical protein
MPKQAPAAQGKSTAAIEAKSGAKLDLKTIPMAELPAQLGSSPDGLSQAEARKRLAQYGPNALEKKHDNPQVIHFKPFDREKVRTSPFVWEVDIPRKRGPFCLEQPYSRCAD